LEGLEKEVVRNRVVKEDVSAALPGLPADTCSPYGLESRKRAVK
jgi:hypothetical protein